MSRRAYEEWAPGADARAIIQTANAICAEYAAQGYDLTRESLSEISRQYEEIAEAYGGSA